MLAGVPGRRVTQPLPGFGFVAPRTEERAVIACTFVDQKFEGRAPEGFKSLRVFAGGAFGRRYFEKDDAALLADIRKDLRELVGIQVMPVFSLVRRHPESMVQYEVGHLRWMQDIRRRIQAHSGLFLAGASYGGVGIPDCVREAETEAQNIFDYLK